MKLEMIILIIIHIALVLSLAPGESYPNNSKSWGILASISIMLLTNIFSQSGPIAFILLIMAVVTHCLMSRRVDQYLVVSMTSANIFLTQTQSLLSFLLGVEALSLASYALLIQEPRTTRNSEAALRIAIPSSFGTLVMALGIYWAYGETGELSFEKTNNVVLIGLAIKLAVFPFALYLIKAFEGAPLGVIVMSTYGKVGILMAISNFSLILSTPMHLYGLLWWAGLATVAFGVVYTLKARRELEWLGSIIVGNAGFVLMLASVSNVYLEWYFLSSQLALIVLIGSKSKPLRFLSLLVFFGFPMTAIFWLKYGFIFSVNQTFFQSVTLLLSGVIITLVGMATGMHIIREKKIKIEESAMTISTIGLISLTILLVVL